MLLVLLSIDHVIVILIGEKNTINWFPCFSFLFFFLCVLDGTFIRLSPPALLFSTLVRQISFGQEYAAVHFLVSNIAVKLTQPYLRGTHVHVLLLK